MRTIRISLSLAVLCLAPACAVQRAYLEESPILIAELHFNPSEEQGAVEFIEITNLGQQPVDLSGWEVTGAGRVSLPSGTTLAPGEALVLTQDVEAFRAAFGDGVTPVATLDGKLRNKGETVRVEDANGLVADEVSYDPADAEVGKASGTGWSLGRVTAASGTWRAAAPTPGRVTRRGSSR